MHRSLHITEILLNIFHHTDTTALQFWGRKPNNGDLAVLARTCRTFKEPALDVLWEKLYDMSALARCLPDACCLAQSTDHRYIFRSFDRPCYSLSRPLKEIEWYTLLGYTRRIRSLICSFERLHYDAARVIFSLPAPFDGPLFPNLQFLDWNGPATFPPMHLAVPSLTALHFLPQYGRPHLTNEVFLNTFRDRCPNMEDFIVDSSPQTAFIDPTVSRAVCCWQKLMRVVCPYVTLTMDAISCLSSFSSLKSLEFTVGEVVLMQGISRLDSKLVFQNLTRLDIKSRLLDPIISLFRCIRLPSLKGLEVVAEGYISRRGFQAYWAAVLEACPFDVLAYFSTNGSMEGVDEEEEEEVILDEEMLACLTLEDIRPCTVFTGLRDLSINFNCPVRLTDADLLEFASPCVEHLSLNYGMGWRSGSGGITLNGLVQLLRQCPSLHTLGLAIDTKTFTQIPEGFDVSFPPRRELKINLVDSYILPEFVPGLVSVFTALGQDPSMSMAWEIGGFGKEERRDQWKLVLDALGSAP